MAESRDEGPADRKPLGTFGKLWETLTPQLRPLAFLSQNFISRTGVVLTTVAGITLVITYASQLFGFALNPYTGILLFFILPGIFLVGLLLIPLGIYRDFRRHKKLGSLPATYPKISLSDTGFPD